MGKKNIMTLDELTRICGYFSIDSSINNYYNCLHPDNEDKEEDDETGKKIGKCIHFYCPIATDLEKEGFAGFSGDHRMRVNPDAIKRVEASDAELKK